METQSELEVKIDWKWVESNVPLILFYIFLIMVTITIVKFPKMFLKRHGRRHALTGLAYFLWISYGFIELGLHNIGLNKFQIPYLLFDIILGILGTTLTLLAAIEFQHKNVKNVASGTLDKHATVTYGEMIEHSFYQALNLLQIIYIHSFSFLSNFNSEIRHQNNILPVYLRILLLFIVTLPWYFRDRFPINKFSDNYTKIDPKSSALIRLLYRIKKYQYVFYKHFLLHGLNISICVSGESLGSIYSFRLYWLLLNFSYVMEFFLQTLVKKNYLNQNNMLILQKILMTASSIAAIVILKGVNIFLCFSSLAFNFMNRKHDLFNTMFITIIYIIVISYIPPIDLSDLNIYL